MFLLEDGRDSLFQWDSNRRLLIKDETINEAHFCNRTDECSLVVAVYEEGGKRYANIPNILLQNDWPINVYGFDKEYTKHSTRFKVNRRTKPADYIYTETEILTYKQLEERLDEIEQSGISQEIIEGAIGKYLEDNPIEAGATEEQAAQIEQNRVDIEALKDKEVDLSDYYTKEETGKAIEDAIAAIDIPEGGGGAVDWEDIENKPFSIESEGETFYSVDGAKAVTPVTNGYKTNSVQSPFTPVAHKEYLISYNGAQYVREFARESMSIDDLEALTGAGDSIVEVNPCAVYILGNEALLNGNRADTGEPFAVVIHQALTGNNATGDTYRLILFQEKASTTGESLVIAEVDETTVIKQLDEVFIPDTIARKAYVDEAIAAIEIPSLEGYALKSEIPDVSGFTTMAAVEQKGYQTESEVNALINTALGVIENGTY